MAAASDGKQGLSTGAIVGVAIGGVAAAVAVVAAGYWGWKRYNDNRSYSKRGWKYGGPTGVQLAAPGPHGTDPGSSMSGLGGLLPDGAAAAISLVGGGGANGYGNVPHTSATEKTWPTEVPTSHNGMPLPQLPQMQPAAGPAVPGFAIPTPASIAAIRWASMGASNNMEMWLGGGGSQLGTEASRMGSSRMNTGSRCVWHAMSAWHALQHLLYSGNAQF